MSLSHQEASISLSSLFIRRQIEWKPHSQKTNHVWSHGPQPCLTQWNYEPCHAGPPKTDGSWWRVLTKRGSLEKGMANHFSILALRTPWTLWKAKNIGHWKMGSPGLWVPNMLLEKNGEITPKRMKRWSQSKNNAQFWIWLVMEVKSDAIKNNIA